ncbi:MAG: sugar kinase [Thermomicrobiaceae bacterium]
MLTSLDIFTFGESMIRLSSPLGQRIETVQSLDLRIGGTESNLSIALARLGRNVAWTSVLPRNPLGQRIARELNWHGVDTSAVTWCDNERIGVYFLDTGTTPRATQVLYDRKDSAVAKSTPDQINMEPADQTRILHLTGITVAISPGCAETCQQLITRAKKAGATFSFDVNYRSLLWSPEEAQAGLNPICEQADILFCGREDAETIWGISGEPEDVVQELHRRFNSNITVTTLGSDGAIIRMPDGSLRRTPSVPVDIVDPVGAGDAFAAGFLHGFLDDDLERALQLAPALAALKMTISGDLAVINPAELEAVVNHNQQGIIR